MYYKGLQIKQRQIYRNTVVPPLLLTPSFICAIAHVHLQGRDPKKVSKGSNLKEDDRAFPL